MTRGLEVVQDKAARRRMQRHVTSFASFARDLQVRHAAPLVLGILDLQPAELVAPERVIEQGGQYRLVALP